MVDDDGYKSRHFKMSTRQILALKLHILTFQCYQARVSWTYGWGCEQPYGAAAYIPVGRFCQGGAARTRFDLAQVRRRSAGPVAPLSAFPRSELEAVLEVPPQVDCDDSALESLPSSIIPSRRMWALNRMLYASINTLYPAVLKRKRCWHSLGDATNIT